MKKCGLSKLITVKLSAKIIYEIFLAGTIEVVLMRYRDMDGVLALFGVLIGFLLLIFSIKIMTGIGLSFTLFVTCFSYFLLANKFKKNPEFEDREFLIEPSKYNSIRMSLVFVSLVFVLLLFFSIFLFYGTYHRSIWYFIAASLFSVIVTLEIYYLPSCLLKDRIILSNILFQIIILSASIILSSIFVFSDIGSDQGFHKYAVSFILQNGYISTDHYYTTAIPAMHVGVSVISLILDLPQYRQNLIVFVGVFYLIALLFIFLIGKNLFEIKTALFATLLAGINIWYINWGNYLVPMSFGISIFLMFTYLIFKNSRSSNVMNFILILFVFLFLFFTHHFIFFSAIIFTFVMFLSRSVYPFVSYNPDLKSNLDTQNVKGRKKKYILSCIIAIILFYLLLSSPFFSSHLQQLVQSFKTLHILNLSSYRSIWHYELDNFGMYILYFFGGIACLHWLNRETTITIHKIVLILCIISYLSIAYLSWILGLTMLYPFRWLVFSSIFLGYPASLGIQMILKLTRGKYKLFFLSIIMFVFTFAMIANTSVNVDSPFYGQENVSRQMLKASEIQAFEFINVHTTEDVYLDAEYYIPISKYHIISRQTEHVHYKNLENINSIDIGIFVLENQPDKCCNEIIKSKRIYYNPELSIFSFLRDNNV